MSCNLPSSANSCIGRCSFLFSSRASALVLAILLIHWDGHLARTTELLKQPLSKFLEQAAPIAIQAFLGVPHVSYVPLG